jgi:V8-like Glu-specific endopeptidase
MHRKVRLFSLVSISSLVLALCLTGQPSFAQIDADQAAASQVTTITATQAEQQAALAAWTREARLAAKPLSLPVMTAADINAAATEAEAIGVSGSVAGGRPNRNAEAAARSQYPEEWQELSEELEEQSLLEDESVGKNNLYAPLIIQGGEQGVTASDVTSPYGTAGVYTSYLGNFYSQMYRYYPYHAVGKLYITGGGYCSASVISPNNIIVTAAHCVYDTVNNRWLNGWTFVPADRNGTAPYGSFPWVSASILNAYISASSNTARYDVAVIKLGNNSAGRPVTYYTGWLGRSWNYNYVQSLHAVGYPSNLNSGRYTYLCAAETASGGTDVLRMGCNMTFGSSGGPWIRVFAPYATGARNYVNSVVSGGTPGTNTFYGIRFTSSNIVTLCNIQGC